MIDSTPGTHPLQRIEILKRFLWVRQNTSHQVIENDSTQWCKVQTYFMRDAEGNLLCEDVFVESRPSIS